jgi:hypothetical protein
LSAPGRGFFHGVVEIGVCEEIEERPHLGVLPQTIEDEGALLGIGAGRCEHFGEARAVHRLGEGWQGESSEDEH